MKSYLQF